jgi:uncharacterized membrane protein (UPF0127 family)
VLAACSPQSQAPAQNSEAPAQTPQPQAEPAAADQTPQVELLGQGPQTGLVEVPLTIRSGARAHRFTVEVAATPEEQERGLMFRKSVAPDRGMIFPYDPPQQVAFWMKNTLIPLDIIFIDTNHKIARITNAKALDLTPLPSGVPVIGVLEIAAGRAAQLGIKEGDAVSW